MENKYQNKYQNGKIYKITDKTNTKCYYGSTIQKSGLWQRLSNHIFNYTQFKHGFLKTKNVVYDIFDEFGIDNCTIKLVELFPCNSKFELETREAYYIKNNECININIPCRTHLQLMRDWRKANKEKIKITNKQYYERRKQDIIEQTN